MLLQLLPGPTDSITFSPKCVSSTFFQPGKKMDPFECSFFSFQAGDLNSLSWFRWFQFIFVTLGSTSLCHHRCVETFICNLSFQMVDIFTEKLYFLLFCLYLYHSNTLFVISFLSHLLIDSSIATTNSLKNIFSSRKDIFSFTFV